MGVEDHLAFAEHDMLKIGGESKAWASGDCGCQSISVLDIAMESRCDKRWQAVSGEVVKYIVKAFVRKIAL